MPVQKFSGSNAKPVKNSNQKMSLIKVLGILGVFVNTAYLAERYLVKQFGQHVIVSIQNSKRLVEFSMQTQFWKKKVER